MESCAFGDSPALADKLADLVLPGLEAGHLPGDKRQSEIRRSWQADGKAERRRQTAGDP